jgi:hypothetical protein
LSWLGWRFVDLCSIGIADQNERGPEVRGGVGVVVVTAGGDGGGGLGRLAGLGTLPSVDAAG